jgi:flavin-dependent dehydrogenase
VPVRHEVDVFVAGGGPAGVAAAVAAARRGTRVFLAERHTCLGGMGTAARVPAFMEFGDGEHFLAGGVGEEVLERLVAAGGTHRYDHAKDYGGCVNIKAEVLMRVYDELMKDAGVDFTFQTPMIAVEAADGHVEAAVCAAKRGIFAVKAHTYVDCTGDGDLAA